MRLKAVEVLALARYEKLRIRSIRQLSERTGYSQAIMSRFWHGGEVHTINADALLAVATLLEVSPFDLLTVEDDSEVSPILEESEVLVS